jgi:Zn-dependent M28 family amino/carboxypeptidase
MSVITALLMADIGRRKAVPGANDNLTGVAVLVGLAESLRERPVKGLRVILLSAGAEETLQEGMRGYADRHFDEFDRDKTWFLNIDSVGCPELTLLEAEGPFKMREYPEGFKDLVARAAERAGVPLRRGMRARTSTDGVVPLRAGFPTATLVSINEFKSIDNYHWPTDVPDNVNLDTVEHALRLADVVVRELEER